MTNDDIREIIRLLLTEKPTVKYTKNDDVSYPDKLPHAPYGYYEIEKCSMGPMFFKVCCPDKMEEGVAPLVYLKTLTKEFYIYKPTRYTKRMDRRLYSENLSLYEDIIKAIQRLPSQNSNLKPNEAKLRFSHFCDPDSKKKSLNEHYLNARVMYDIMHEMMGAKCTFSRRRGGYVIKASFDDGYIETIGIKRTAGYYDISKVTYGVMNIFIPSVRLSDNFDDNTNSVEWMLFKKAEEFINMANSRQHNRTVSEPENFTRWDQPYIDMMAEIKSHRVKAK